MSKYAPLTDRLNQHQGDRWRARFSEIEQVLGFQLPKSARQYPAWWGSISHIVRFWSLNWRGPPNYQKWLGMT